MPFTLEEIKSVVFDFRRDKAPEPDGFPLFFFRQYRDTVKDDLWKLCDDFLFGRANLERINWLVLR